MAEKPEKKAPAWAVSYRSWWKKYVYKLIGAEISSTTAFCDACIQIAPHEHDTGLLFEAISCPKKSVVASVDEVPEHRLEKEKRFSFVLNGNFNYFSDIQATLEILHKKLSRHSRVFLVIYNPYIGFFYSVASWLGIRKAPKPNVHLTENDLRTFTKLTHYEVVKIRPSVYLPFYIPVLSDLINSFQPIIPIIRRLSLVWVVALRPIVPEEENPSLSIIIPARNESGNIEDAIERLPKFPNTEVEVIFVEGNSTDDTWENIQRCVGKGHDHFTLKAFKQPGKGKNDAVRVGFDKASCELVTILDADLTTPPERLPRFYNAYKEGLGDFINGSRLVYPMENEAMRSLNRMGNIFFSKVLSWVLGLPISDSLCGTKLYPLHDYKRFVLWRETFGDFDPFGDFEMLFAASELALGIIDVPIRYRARTYGETNISRFRNGFELARMTMIGFFRVRLGKRK